MKTITLTQNRFAIVDDEDYEWLSQWNWYAQFGHGIYYAVRNDYTNGHKQIRMHREIMGRTTGKFIDHRNGNGLDNHKENLRACTNRQKHTERQEKGERRIPIQRLALVFKD